MAKLTYAAEGGRAEEIAVDDEPVTVGRQLGNVLTLKDDRVSRFHAVVEFRRGVLGVRDLGSRNGTLVNGERIEKGRRLKTGDQVTIGGTTLAVDLGDGQEGANGEAVPAAAPAKMEPATGPRDLAKLAGSLPERNVKPADMQLLNARGQKALDRRDAKGEGPPAEAVTLLRLTLLVCFRTGASDIHLEPKTDGYVLRVRNDGTMVDLAKLTKSAGTKFAALVKVLADCDIAKSNVVQEGSFACRVPDRRVDYRVSLTPGLYGQKLVIRVLDAANAPQYLWDLGLGEAEFESLDRLTRRNEGLLLVCGPTGSGKSSTLYAVLRSIDAKERNVVTIEDPVEIRLDGITQQPVNDQQGNTFAALLRSVLRQDPDVVLVGEIRDNETATTAVQAGTTGHLVFSTLHARDSVSALFRLLDLGVETYQAASGLQAVVSQRLVRRLCEHCKRPRPATDADRRLAGRPDLETLHDAVGCARCLNTGYGGRRAVFEVLNITEPVRDAILGNKDARRPVRRAQGHRLPAAAGERDRPGGRGRDDPGRGRPGRRLTGPPARGPARGPRVWYPGRHMSSGPRNIVVAASLALPATAAFAGGIGGLGDLAGGGFGSAAFAVSNDGRTVVGAGTDAGGTAPIRWTLAGGLMPLDGDGTAFGLTGDGTTAVGESGGRATLWAGGEVLDLGDLSGGTGASAAAAVAAGGDVAVGVADSTQGRQAFPLDGRRRHDRPGRPARRHLPKHRQRPDARRERGRRRRPRARSASRPSAGRMTRAW